MMRAWPALLFACSCGLDENGILQPGSDASIEADVVVSPDAQPDVAKEAGPPQPCSVDAGACVANLPPGWELVAFDPSNQNACPSNFTSAPVVSSVSPDASACGCGCTVTKTPACDVGSLVRYVSNDNTCSMTGVTLSVNGGGCTAYPPSNALSASAKSSPLPPSGGTCTGDVAKNPAGFTKVSGASCKVPSACEEQFCGGDVPGGFQRCIQQSGTQACPNGWANPVVVGDDFTFDCSACSCDVNGPSTCTGATLDIFGDTQCTNKLVTLPVDGTCAADSAQGKDPNGFAYHATLTQACNATGAKTASNVQLVNERTICCK
ncbi:MAG TPA: hypothetical protein VGH87_18765 [Polyangiaceae bacterium]